MERKDVYALIDGERAYQESMGKKHNWGQGTGQSDNHTIGDFLVMLEVYTRRAMDAWTSYEGGDSKSLDVIRKVAGIAVACMEKHGAPAREQSK